MHKLLASSVLRSIRSSSWSRRLCSASTLSRWTSKTDDDLEVPNQLATICSCHHSRHIHYKELPELASWGLATVQAVVVFPFGFWANGGLVSGFDAACDPISLDLMFRCLLISVTSVAWTISMFFGITGFATLHKSIPAYPILKKRKEQDAVLNLSLDFKTKEVILTTWNNQTFKTHLKDVKLHKRYSKDLAAKSFIIEAPQFPRSFPIEDLDADNPVIFSLLLSLTQSQCTLEDVEKLLFGWTKIGNVKDFQEPDEKKCWAIDVGSIVPIPHGFTLSKINGDWKLWKRWTNLKFVDTAQENKFPRHAFLSGSSVREDEEGNLWTEIGKRLLEDANSATPRSFMTDQF